MSELNKWCLSYVTPKPLVLAKSPIKRFEAKPRDLYFVGGYNTREAGLEKSGQ